ncbi:hypothetical protein DH2020_019384 [Rehmannia glutinosa]|uniref:Pectinesterase catalytic domain-containing protein n=1 Tax=Rehmannia glutinosa TaxID=99300 RepID=A0ABR0WLR2_REHGL
MASPSLSPTSLHSASNDASEPPCVDIEVDVESHTPPPPPISDTPFRSPTQSPPRPHFPTTIRSPTPPSIPPTPFLLRASREVDGFDVQNHVPAQRRIQWRRVVKVVVFSSMIILIGVLATLYFTSKRGKTSQTKPECEVNITVSKDRQSNFTTISEAVEASPSYSPYRVCISVGSGEYHEMVNIGDDKTNIILMGEGIGRTIISSNATREEPDSPSPLATLWINGKGFLARDLTVVNTAKYGVAVKNWAKNSVFFRCRLQGVDATLSIRAQNQFYRSCQLYGGNNSISGIARAFFQKCEFRSEKSYPEEKIVFSSLSTPLLTFESRFVFHLCSFYVDKFQNNRSETTFIGSSLGKRASFVIMQSYLDASVSGYFLDTSPPNSITYFAIFGNVGSGATANIPPFIHVLDEVEASSKYSLRVFLGRDDWVPPRVEYDLDLIKSF